MSDIERIQQSLDQNFANTNSKIDAIQKTLDEKIEKLRDDVDSHGERIRTLETYASTDGRRINDLSTQMEVLKQDRLRNNIRLTGLPPLAFEDTDKTVMSCSWCTA